MSDVKEFVGALVVVGGNGVKIRCDDIRVRDGVLIAERDYDKTVALFTKWDCAQMLTAEEFEEIKP